MERLSIAESLRRKDKRRRRGWTVVVGNEIRWVEHKSAMLQLFSGDSYQDQATALWRVEQLLPCFAIAALMSLLRTSRNYCVRVRDTDMKPRKFQIVISAPLFVFLSRLTSWFYYVCHVRDRIMFWLKNCLKSKRIDESSMGEFCCTLWHAVIIFFWSQQHSQLLLFILNLSWNSKNTAHKIIFSGYSKA